ncbi:MAG: class I SAM-dependent methyltransferase [Jatrophihabitans sp.]|nr:MAG: class I SAM-dependent methyltransferase [Jatrophihabitans sp.]
MTTPTLGEQASALLTHVAGFVAHRTIAMGLRNGLIGTLSVAGRPLSADELADRLHLDPFYVAVWCRAALAAGVCDRGGADAGLGGRYELAAHVGTLLLDAGHPGYAGGVFTVLELPEVFDRFEGSLTDGARMWWDDCSPAWIEGVAGTGAPFYTRLLASGFAQITGLAERLDAGCVVADIACGSGAGLVRLAAAYPRCTLVGVDGDRHSLELAARRCDDAGVGDRCTLVHGPLEEFTLPEPATLVINNISMHECRDIDRVAENVRRSLEPGGWFVISDFPFPDSVEQLRSVPGRVMAGIQFFEAQIDDQLLPRQCYDDLLRRHGFGDPASMQLSPVHAVTYARTVPASVTSASATAQAPAMAHSQP